MHLPNTSQCDVILTKFLTSFKVREITIQEERIQKKMDKNNINTFHADVNYTSSENDVTSEQALPIG